MNEQSSTEDSQQPEKPSENIENETKNLSEKEEYFKMLEIWTTQFNTANLNHKMISFFPYYLMSQYQFQQSNLQQQQQNQVRNPRRTTDIILDPARHEEIIREHGGYNYVIASLFKRLIAEIIDIFILFILKLLLAFVVIDLFDVNIGFELDFDTLKNYLEDDYKEILSFTSEFLILEIVTKIAACFYEAIWISQVSAATPGKMLMGIKVLHCEAVLPLEQGNNHGGIRALVYPATNLGFRRSLFRSVAKNVLITLLFPMYFILFFFRSNQMVYDLICRSIVVEENNNPRLIFHRP